MLSFFRDTQQIPDETSAKPGSENNPVGKLQEICMKRRWRPPSYETVNEIGLPHERVFTMTCIIENIEMEVQGIGRSKKIAKRNAALEILKKLEEMKIYQPSLENQVSFEFIIILFLLYKTFNRKNHQDITMTLRFFTILHQHQMPEQRKGLRSSTKILGKN